LYRRLEEEPTACLDVLVKEKMFASDGNRTQGDPVHSEIKHRKLEFLNDAGTALRAVIKVSTL
jgi:hypothetical protein